LTATASDLPSGDYIQINDDDGQSNFGQFCAVNTNPCVLSDTEGAPDTYSARISDSDVTFNDLANSNNVSVNWPVPTVNLVADSDTPTEGTAVNLSATTTNFIAGDQINIYDSGGYLNDTCFTDVCEVSDLEPGSDTYVAQLNDGTYDELTQSDPLTVTWAAVPPQDGETLTVSSNIDANMSNEYVDLTLSNGADGVTYTLESAASASGPFAPAEDFGGYCNGPTGATSCEEISGAPGSGPEYFEMVGTDDSVSNIVEITW
jgi:hypothetical protein